MKGRNCKCSIVCSNRRPNFYEAGADDRDGERRCRHFRHHGTGSFIQQLAVTECPCASAGHPSNHRPTTEGKEG
jgi:hypothetical protein